MITALITFTVMGQDGSRSGQIITHAQMDERTLFALSEDMTRTRGANLSNWIKTNLIGTILEQAQPSGEWTVVDPSIVKSNH